MSHSQPSSPVSDPGILLGIAVLAIGGIVFARTDFFLANISRGSAIGGLLAGPLFLVTWWLVDRLGTRRAARQRAGSLPSRAVIG